MGTAWEACDCVRITVEIRVNRNCEVTAVDEICLLLFAFPQLKTRHKEPEGGKSGVKRGSYQRVTHKM